ncbi:MAG: hypothetical protein AAGL08_21200, partial [Cyanobacteria bacterium J06573_11]
MHSYFVHRVACCHITVSADKSVLSNSTDAIEAAIHAQLSTPKGSPKEIKMAKWTDESSLISFVFPL